jgi:hypothetical protein
MGQRRRDTDVGLHVKGLSMIDWLDRYRRSNVDVVRQIVVHCIATLTHRNIELPFAVVPNKTSMERSVTKRNIRRRRQATKDDSGVEELQVPRLKFLRQ